MKAWHFLPNDGYLRYGERIKPKIGQKLTVDPDKLEMCEYGLHASVKSIDALQYAPGHIICRVKLGGTIIKGDDKVAASERTILRMADAEDTLWRFARLCALDVINLWDAPDVVVRYLRTGDEKLRDAARDAARAAAWDAARDAAWTAARAARDAARDAARGAAWDAARAAQNRRLTRMLNELLREKR